MDKGTSEADLDEAIRRSLVDHDVTNGSDVSEGTLAEIEALQNTDPTMGSDVSEGTLAEIAALQEADNDMSSDVSEATLAAIRASEGKEIVESPSTGGFSAPRELQNTARHSLAVVAKALSKALAGVDGAALLSLSCPFIDSISSQSVFQEMIVKWLEKFVHITETMPTDITDDDAKSFLKVALRGIMQVVAIWHRDSDHDRILNLTKDWIISVLVQLTGGSIRESGIDMNRLCNMLTVVSAKEVGELENVSDALSRFGCTQDRIANLSKDVALALLKKLYEWQETGEEETFTSRQLVEDGRLAAGLGLVERRGTAGSAVHVFVYDLASLRDWVLRSGNDPLSRQPLDVGEISEIS